MKVRQEGNRLIIAEGVSQVWIDPWGENSVRVRMTKESELPEKLLLNLSNTRFE